MPLRIADNIRDQLAAEAARAAPRECCGLLLGHGDRIDSIAVSPNIHPAPESHFEIDPQLLIDAHRAARSGGPQILGYYHSHPRGAPHPSATDQALAHGDGMIWAIIARHAITFWRDADGGFQPLHPA